MKTALLFSLVSLLALGVSLAETAEEKKKRMLSGRSVLAIAKQSETEGVVNKSFDVEKQERSMLDGMTILGSAGQWTVVPANAFLAKSPILQKYVLEKPNGTFTQWSAFSSRNRAWLDSHEVTVETIKGDDPITEEQLEAFEKSRKAIVATYNGSPVSVLPPKPKIKE